MEVTFVQPHTQFWSLGPAVAVGASGMLIINLVVCSIAVFVTVLSADEPSSAPALAGSRGSSDDDDD